MFHYHGVVALISDTYYYNRSKGHLRPEQDTYQYAIFSILRAMSVTNVTSSLLTH